MQNDAVQSATTPNQAETARSFGDLQLRLSQLDLLETVQHAQEYGFGYIYDGTTIVEPPALVTSSHAQQKVTNWLASGKGAGVQF